MDTCDVIAEGVSGLGRPASEPISQAQEVDDKAPGPDCEEHDPTEPSGVTVAGADEAPSLLPPPPKAVKTLLGGDLMVYLEEVPTTQLTPSPLISVS